MLAKQNQSGFAVLLLLLLMIVIGGFALTGYSKEALQQVNDNNFQHNKEVLEEAKQALLMYAYRYPAIAGRGPGRMPCPDSDDSSTPNATPNCILAGNAVVGRFPWNANGMNFYDARDSSGERLWYAVSSTFANGPATIINSDDTGTISIFNQTGNLLYDGAVSGVAAIIIAPGPEINGQNRNLDSLDPANYLDAFNGFDNSSFVNSSNADADGFILGPVFNPVQNTYTINDQMVIVSTEEVVAMAEKATLQVYRDAIDVYQQNIWGTTVANYRYPWLDDYSTSDLTQFDADINTVVGRVPSIFSDYFTATGNDSQLIKPELIISINIDGERHNLKIGAPGAPEVYFKANGDLVSSIDGGDTITRYFWDGDDTTPHVNSPNDGVWEVCPFDTGTEEDCNRDIFGSFKNPHGASSDVELRVRLVTIDFSGGTPIEFDLFNRTALPSEYWEAGTPENPSITNHVYFAAEYGGSGAYISNFSYTQDDDFLNSFTVQSSGTFVFNPGDTIKVGLPYYPVIPNWALDNDWHNTIQMAFAPDYQLDGAGDCTANPPCLTVNDIGGVNNNKAAILSIAGDVLDPIDDGAAGYADDLPEIFEAENSNLDVVFSGRSGNDKILILREQ